MAILTKLSLHLVAYGGRAGAKENQTHVLSHFLFHLSKSLLSGSKLLLKHKRMYTLQTISLSVRVFSKFHTQNVIDAEKHCAFFLNQNCLTDETWPPEATLDGTGHSPTLSGSGILLAFTDLNNFSWLRRDPRETILTHLLTEAKKSSADQGRRAWKRTLVSTPGPWPPDHSTSSFLHLDKGQKRAPDTYSLYIFSPPTCMLEPGLTL